AGRCPSPPSRRSSARRRRSATARRSSPRRSRAASCTARSPGWRPKWKRGCPVTVAELQLLLSDLSRFLRAAASSQAAAELEYVSAKLLPFGQYKLRAFADFLEKAEAYSRGEPAPKKPARAGKVKADPTALDQACERVRQLYDRAIDPAVGVEQIEAAV